MNAFPPDSSDTDPQTEPASLRVLRRLVATLMVVMILGVLVIVGLLVTRLSADRAPTLPETLPDNLALPAGATPEAVTLGKGWIAVVTGDRQILIYDANSGKLRQTIQLD